MSGVILSPAEIRDITGYSRPSEQRRVLNMHGIPYKAIGSRTIVLASHVSAWVEGRPVRQNVEPNLSLVR